MEYTAIKIKEFDVIISKCDLERISEHRWFPIRSRPNLIYFGFWTPRPNRKTIYLHKFLMGNPIDKVVDHINCNTLDNRRENLRICAQSENMRNVKKSEKRKNPYKGVSFFDLANKWRARIQINKKQIHLGYFNSPEEARDEYINASKKYHSEFGRVD